MNDPLLLAAGFTAAIGAFILWWLSTGPGPDGRA
jgi:hypothetical protein